jgi:4'-phosphopantetheinyl transferase EntD
MPHLSPQPCVFSCCGPLVHGASCRALHRSQTLLCSVGTDIEKAQSAIAQREMLAAVTSTNNKAIIITVRCSKRDFKLGAYL